MNHRSKSSSGGGRQLGRAGRERIRALHGTASLPALHGNHTPATNRPARRTVVHHAHAAAAASGARLEDDWVSRLLGKYLSLLCIHQRVVGARHNRHAALLQAAVCKECRLAVRQHAVWQ